MSIQLSARKIIELSVTVGKEHEVGHTPEGFLRVIPITGGTFSGENFKGVVLPGGADWNYEINGHLSVVSAKYCIQEDDGTVISIENNGRIDFSGISRIKTTPRFAVTTDDSKYSVFQEGVFVGELNASKRNEGVIEITVYKLD